MAFLDDVIGGFKKDPLRTGLTGGLVGIPGAFGLTGLKERSARKNASDPNAALNFFEQNNPGVVNPRGAGFRELSKNVSRGPSAFARIGDLEALKEEAKVRDDLLQRAGSEGAAASTRLATKGGLTSGAAERIAKATGEAGTLAGQKAGQAGTFARLKGNLAALEADQQNIANLTTSEQSAAQIEQAAKDKQFAILAELFGAGKQADIIQKQGSPGLLGGGGFLGLGF